MGKLHLLRQEPPILYIQGLVVLFIIVIIIKPLPLTSSWKEACKVCIIYFFIALARRCACPRPPPRTK